MDEAKMRLLKNIEKVKRKNGMTAELENKVLNLYIFDKLTDDEMASIIDVAEENEDE